MLAFNALSGQTLAPTELEDSLADLSVPPLDRVIDLGEVFKVDGAPRKELSRRLNELDDRYQFSVYFVAYSGIIGSDASEKASEFRDLWLGTEVEGLVFVCDTDMKSIAYSLTKVKSFPLDGSNPTWRLPDREVNQAMLEIGKIDAEGMDEEVYLSTIGQNLVTALESRLQPKQKAGRKGAAGILGAVTVTVLLIGWGVWWIRRKSNTMAEEIEKSLFPTIEVPNRLGAHFGGGMVSEISFHVPRSSSDS